MKGRPASAMRWLKRAALVVACVVVAAVGWARYHAGDSQAALAALWSLCGLAP